MKPTFNMLSYFIWFNTNSLYMISDTTWNMQIPHYIKIIMYETDFLWWKLINLLFWMKDCFLIHISLSNYYLTLHIDKKLKNQPNNRKPQIKLKVNIWYIAIMCKLILKQTSRTHTPTNVRGCLIRRHIQSCIKYIKAITTGRPLQIDVVDCRLHF